MNLTIIYDVLFLILYLLIISSSIVVILNSNKCKLVPALSILFFMSIATFIAIAFVFGIDIIASVFGVQTQQFYSILLCVAVVFLLSLFFFKVRSSKKEIVFMHIPKNGRKKFAKALKEELHIGNTFVNYQPNALTFSEAIIAVKEKNGSISQLLTIKYDYLGLIKITEKCLQIVPMNEIKGKSLKAYQEVFLKKSVTPNIITFLAALTATFLYMYFLTNGIYVLNNPTSMLFAFVPIMLLVYASRG